MEKYLGFFALIMVTVIWGGGFVASDMALETFTPFQIMFLRFLTASIIMGLPAQRAIRCINKKNIIRSIPLGAALFGGFALQIIGLQFTTPSKNAFLTATNVVMVPVIAMIFGRKKISAQGIAGAVIALAGAGVLSIQSGFVIGKGDVLSLLCAVCFAAQIYLTSLLVHKIDPSVLNFLQMLTAFILSFAGLSFTGGFSMHPSLKSALAVLYLGVVSTSICYFLQTWAQKYVDETGAAIILSMESVFGTVFSVIILHERITPRMIAGSILILCAVLISELGGKTSVKKADGMHENCENS